MSHKGNSRFWGLYDALSEETRARADKQFALLKVNPKHPSLRFKKIGERNGDEIWSVRVTLNHRALAIRRHTAFSGSGSANIMFTTI